MDAEVTTEAKKGQVAAQTSNNFANNCSQLFY